MSDTRVVYNDGVITQIHHDLVLHNRCWLHLSRMLVINSYFNKKKKKKKKNKKNKKKKIQSAQKFGGNISWSLAQIIRGALKMSFVNNFNM